MLPGLRFDRTSVAVPAGPISITVVNQDTAVAHNFAVYTDSSASRPLAGAGANICTAPCSFVLSFTSPPGVYYFRCDVHPADMNGAVVVQ
jgi:plastocyanin